MTIEEQKKHFTQKTEEAYAFLKESGFTNVFCLLAKEDAPIAGKTLSSIIVDGSPKIIVGEITEAMNRTPAIANIIIHAFIHYAIGITDHKKSYTMDEILDAAKVKMGDNHS